MSVRVGIDTGGTFTDLVAVDPVTETTYVAKVPSTPAAPIEAVLAALADAAVPADDVEHVVLGTTVGANAVIERRGAPVAYVATGGFEDVPFIQRGNRRYHYDLHWRKPNPFIDRWQSFGAPERVAADGKVVTALEPDDAARLAAELAAVAEREGLEAVAINFLFSYLNPTHERLLAESLQRAAPQLAISVSHEVAPVWREYERGVTTIVDAYLKPLFETFADSILKGLTHTGIRGQCSLLRSNGGTQPLQQAVSAPVHLLLSGIAGGVMAGKRFGQKISEDLITLDMGGTSADIAVISGREHRIAATHEVEFGLPLVTPAIDVTTIGAGGGSIAWIDRGGFLRVGPHSAGADPGPACYARGATEATVTDANLVLGRLDPDYFLGGEIALDRDAAFSALGRLGAQLGLSAAQAALAVVAIANEEMVNAIRVRTVEVGVDPRRYCLIAFGGAGPLHATAIARRLGITQVVVPARPGLGSALGALTADLRSDQVATVHARSDSDCADQLQARADVLRSSALAEISSAGNGATVTTRLGLRYAGQNYEHEVQLPSSPITAPVLDEAFAQFGQMHREFYGFDLRGGVIEIVDLTVTASIASRIGLPQPDAPSRRGATRRELHFAAGPRDATVVHRKAIEPGTRLAGPALVQDTNATTLIEEHDSLVALEDGSLMIYVETGGPEP